MHGNGIGGMPRRQVVNLGHVFSASEKNRTASAARLTSCSTLSGASLNDKGLAPPPSVFSFTAYSLGSEDSGNSAPANGDSNGFKAILATRSATDVVAGASPNAEECAVRNRADHRSILLVLS